MQTMIITYLLFLVGLVLIMKGGDFFVDGATWVARRTGLPEVLIGATIVSLATTSPEAMVSLISSLEGHPDVALGNAVGSIICNTGLILGLYNIIKPSKIESRIFKLKGLMMVGYIVFLWFSASKGFIGPLSALGLLILLAVYLIFNVSIVHYNKSRAGKHKSKHIPEPGETSRNILKFVVGVAMILIGANFLVTNGVEIARYWGIPESVVSLTMIALGTSLPELITSMTALFKGRAGLSIGNILGANILNVSLVVGLSSSVSTLTVPADAITRDIPVAIGITSLLVIPSIFTKKVSRIQGALLLGSYLTYLVVLFLQMKT